MNAEEFDCPICLTMANEWGRYGCSCWLCYCNTTNPQSSTICRHCGKRPTYRVSLDGVATWFPCSGFLNGGETWNGFTQPIFTAEQLEIVAQWYESENIEEQVGQTFAENVTDLGHGEYHLEGWAFSLDA